MKEPARTSSQTIRQTVGQYYADRLGQFGPTPRGVDWNSAESQELRFQQLVELLAPPVGDEVQSVVDVGCGYGALLDYLRARGLPLEYRGLDVSDAMVQAARARHAATPGCSFTVDAGAIEPATYAVSSGIFNVKLAYPVETWRAYMMDTLASLDGFGTRGFAFNMLSTYSDPERRRENLYYGDPRELFDICKRRFSARVALLHDYPLYEFTIIVRK